MNPNFVIMGLPESGKTTFLAALWHVVQAEEKPCRLKLDKLEGDLTYLNAIAEAWRTYRPVARTSQTGDTDVAMHLVDSVSMAQGTAFFPDIAGERFSDQVEARRSRRTFVDNVEKCDGILLFISANSKQDYLSVVELNSMMPPEPENETDASEACRKPLAAGARQAEASADSAPAWAPKHIAGEVRMVQIVSDLLRRPFKMRLRRVAVIISAWDIALVTRMSPRQWLAGNMPLLDQFLRTNSDHFKSHIYGVSAQGIDLDDHDAVARVSKKSASERILIVDGTEPGHDITAPLVWLMADG
jgi:hypothetical protein